MKYAKHVVICQPEVPSPEQQYLLQCLINQVPEEFLCTVIPCEQFETLTSKSPRISAHAVVHLSQPKHKTYQYPQWMLYPFTSEPHIHRKSINQPQPIYPAYPDDSIHAFHIVENALRHGHRDIGLITHLSRPHQACVQGVQWARNRYALPVQNQWHCALSTGEDILSIIMAWLKINPKFSYIYTPDMDIAEQCFWACKLLSIHVPQQISIVAGNQHGTWGSQHLTHLFKPYTAWIDELWHSIINQAACHNLTEHAQLDWKKPLTSFIERVI